MNKDKLPEKMKAVMAENPKLPIDVHCHLITKTYVPDKFLKMRVSMTKKTLNGLAHILHRICNKSDSDKLSHYAYFLETAASDSMEVIARKLFSYYDDHQLFGKDMILCPLMMDLKPSSKSGYRGDKFEDYTEQMRELAELRDKYPDRILPFLAVDPRRENLYSDFFQASFEEGRFFGIKVYPSLGYLPSHPELMKIFKVCEEQKIPVTSHCGTGTIHSAYRRLKNIQGIQPGRRMPETQTFLTSKAFAQYFNKPDNWRPVLEQYPDLHLNLAHFGSTDEWNKYMKGKDNTWIPRIMDLIYRYPNVYTDISYLMTRKALYQPLRKLLKRNKHLRKRVLYGSDYYMTVKEGHFRTMLSDFTTAMGEEIIRKMSAENNRRFLGL